MANDLLNLIIVDDDTTLANAIKLMAPTGFKVFICNEPQNIPENIFFHAAMVDMYITADIGETPDGPLAIEKLLKLNPQTEIVSMSGDLDRSNMEAAIKAGASRFLAKPLMSSEVTLILDKISAYWQLRKVEYANQKKTYLVGQSSSTETLRKYIASLKGERGPVLIEGETGSGKEVVARLLTQQEAQIPFVTVNCAAISEQLFESEFFGHVKGAFTGADQNKIGLAEAAHGGDLFLDEIEALPLSQQAKLLRFLESGEVKRVGAKDSINVDVRIIAASNQPLQDLIKEKKFREDLYFRLASHKIEITPLRQRVFDIPFLVEYFIANSKTRRHKYFDESGIHALQSYTWPGNVRELKRVCEQLLLTSPLPLIRAEDIKRLITVKTDDIQPTQQKSFNEITLDDFTQLQEKEYLTYLFEKYKNFDKVLSIVQISKSNLYRKIKDYNLNYE